MEGPISFWGYKEQESNLIIPEHDDNDDDKGMILLKLDKASRRFSRLHERADNCQGVLSS
jgi:hypothetical protein